MSVACKYSHLQQSFYINCLVFIIGSHQGCGVSGYWDFSLSLPSLLYFFFSLLILALFSESLFFANFFSLMCSFHSIISPLWPLVAPCGSLHLSPPLSLFRKYSFPDPAVLAWTRLAAPTSFSLFLAKALFSLHPNL